MSNQTSGTSVAVSGLMLTLGGVLIFSALTGTSITDVLAGKKASTLDAQGGSLLTIGAPGAGTDVLGGTDTLGGPAVDAITGAGGSVRTFGFKGPRAALLEQLANAAENQFNLKVTSVTSGVHVPGSYHYQGRAFDASGSEANMRAYANYVISAHLSEILELILNPGQCVKNGRVVNGSLIYAAVWLGHRDHVHTAA
jgi:hypothetical protein